MADEIGGEGYTLITWGKEADKNIKEALYLSEQDEYFGTYRNDRKGFDEVWEKEEYEPVGSINFSKN